MITLHQNMHRPLVDIDWLRGQQRWMKHQAIWCGSDWALFPFSQPQPVRLFNFEPPGCGGSRSRRWQRRKLPHSTTPRKRRTPNEIVWNPSDVCKSWDVILALLRVEQVWGPNMVAVQEPWNKGQDTTHQPREMRIGDKPEFPSERAT